MSIDTLKEMMGQEVSDGIDYRLPQLHRDALDSVGNIQKYAAAKAVLNHPEVNPVLKEMKAFDALNKFSVEPAYEMAQWVVEALCDYYGLEGESYYKEFPFLIESDELSEFSREFITELSSMKAGAMPDVGADMPDVDQGWFDKFAAKFGFHDIGFKELMWLYVMNQAKQGMAKKEPNPMEIPAEPVVTEAVLAGISEEPFEGLTEWVESVTASYAKELGQNWGEVLHEKALDEFFNEIVDITTVVEQDDSGLESGAYDDDRPAPKPSAKVKADVKQRVAELSKLIADDKKKQHFYGDVKPAVYNAKEALDRIMDFLNMGTMGGYKKAQIHLQKLMSPITNLFPPTLIKFLAYANDGEDSKVMKPVNEDWREQSRSAEQALGAIRELLERGEEVPDELMQKVAGDENYALDAALSFLKHTGYIPEPLPAIYGRRGAK